MGHLTLFLSLRELCEGNLVGGDFIVTLDDM